VLVIKKRKANEIKDLHERLKDMNPDERTEDDGEDDDE
jgi:hypothetical protein